MNIKLYNNFIMYNYMGICKLFWINLDITLLFFLDIISIGSIIWLIILLKQSSGKGKQLDIAKLIRSSSLIYLKEQYKVILAIMALLSIPIWYFFGIGVVSFLNGILIAAGCSSLSIIVSTLINVKTVEVAKKSLSSAFYFVFYCASSLSLIFITISIFTVLSTISICKSRFFINIKDLLTCLCIGVSLVSIFTRLGGGIFTKGADVGADMVGKIEKDMKEDDARNPAVIADNVGDNIGDGSGTTADLVESLIISLSSSTLLILNTLKSPESFSLIYKTFFLIFGGCITSLISLFTLRLFLKSQDQFQSFDPENAIRKFNFLSCFLLILIGIFISAKLGLAYNHLYCFIVGVLCAFASIKLTEYYTSTKHSPVQEICEASEYGHGANVISGISLGFASILPAVLISTIGVITCSYFSGLIGIAFGTIGVMSWATSVLSQDLIGPVVDNAGGIAVMADLPEEIRERTDRLDILGNTTKAIAKGYTLTSALFTSILMFYYFESNLNSLLKISSSSTGLLLNITNPIIVFSILIGITLPFVFSTFALKSVGKAAQSVVQEIRHQLSNPLIISGQIDPDYKSTIVSLTHQSLKGMIFPSLLPIIFPCVLFSITLLCFGTIEAFQSLSCFIIGNTMSGSVQSIFMITAGGAWDNAKKLLESRNKKHTDTYKFAVTGDTVGDPFKDTAGPSLNSLIKLTNLVGILIISIYKKCL